MTAAHVSPRFRFSLRGLLIAFAVIAIALVVYPMIRLHRIEREMLANTAAQLEDDILSYEWLHALARHHHPSGTPPH